MSILSRPSRIIIGVAVSLFIIFLILLNFNRLSSTFDKPIFKSIIQIGGRLSTPVPTSPQPRPQPTITSVPQNSKPILSPTGEFYLIFIAKQINVEEYEIALLHDTFTRSNGLTLWSGTVNNTQLSRYINSGETTVSWSSAKNQFAFASPEKLMIFDYTKTPITSWNPDNADIKRYSLDITKKQEISIPEDRKELYQILYSTKGNVLYTVSKAGISKIVDDKFVNLLIQGVNNRNSAYPIPNSDGIAYFTNISSTLSSTHVIENSIIFDYGSTFKKYDFDSKDIDYIFDAKFSPSTDKVCMKVGSSASVWGEIRTLNTGKVIYGFGDCVKWQDNTHVIVNFGYKGTYSVLNTETGKHSFLFYDNDSL